MPRDYSEQPQTEGSLAVTLLVIGFMLGFVLTALGFFSVVKESMDPCIRGPEGGSCSDFRMLVPIGLGVVGLTLAGLVALLGRRRRKAGWEIAR